LGEDGQGFAHGRLAEREAARELALDQHLPGREGQRQDVLPERLVDALLLRRAARRGTADAGGNASESHR
jgi:hypothetical protein